MHEIRANHYMRYRLFQPEHCLSLLIGVDYAVSSERCVCHDFREIAGNIGDIRIVYLRQLSE